MVLCIGDSLTLGMVGYSYIPFANSKYQFINKGVNGDSLYGGVKRLKGYLKKDRYKGVDTIVLALGTNDILLPHLGRQSLCWNMQYQMRNLIRKFSFHVQDFTKLYCSIVKEMSALGYKLVLVGLPYIQLPGYPLGYIREYNHRIARIAAQYGAEYIDMYALQEPLLGKRRTYSWGKSNFGRITDGTYMALFPMEKDRLSKRRGLDLTVDGVHYNSKSAKLLAAAVVKALDRMGTSP